MKNADGSSLERQSSVWDMGKLQPTHCRHTCLEVFPSFWAGRWEGKYGLCFKYHGPFLTLLSFSSFLCEYIFLHLVYAIRQFWDWFFFSSFTGEWVHRGVLNVIPEVECEIFSSLIFKKSPIQIHCFL